MTFKKGDIVRVREGLTQYAITCPGSVGVVLEPMDHGSVVVDFKILRHVHGEERHTFPKFFTRIWPIPSDDLERVDPSETAITKRILAELI